MDKNYFLAKTYKNKDGSYKTETIKEHTDKLLLLFDNFMNIYGDSFSKEERELIYIACQTHDLGKMNSRFQKKLYKSIGKEKDYEKDEDLEKLYKKLQIEEIPHGVLSASFIDIPKLKEKFDDEYIEVLASAVYNHHARAVVDKNGNNIVDTSIKDIVDNDITKYMALYDDTMKCSFRGVKKNVVKDNSNNTYSFYLKFIVVKGILNKLDYAASAGIKILEIEPNNACECVRKKIEEKKFKLNDCQEFMKSNSDKNLVVVASTGIGKTEGALLWAGTSKTFYTLPIKVSINAIYKRIIKDNYYAKDKVTFLHSDSRSMMMKDDEDNYETRYIETKHLTYPLTVCTVDQLFYFVFKSLGTEKFPATLKYSKIVIDEIQSYSPDVIAFIIYGLKVITDLGGQFLIMTATLPPVVKHFLIDTLNKSESARELVIETKPFFKRDGNKNIIKRHFIDYIESDFNYENIVEHAREKKILVICNTVKRAQEVYKKIKDIADCIDVNLLHSRFILGDRRIKEGCIQKFAPNDEDKRNSKHGIWISTQIVEASLDIDFDILYTDMCTADSLLQRMGRCYRSRVYNGNIANVFLYKNDDEKAIGVGSVYDEDIFKFSSEYIKHYSGSIFSEEDKIKYIEDVYNVDRLKLINREDSYYKTIENKLNTLDKLSLSAVDNDTAKKQFRNIHNITVIPRKFYNELEKENIFEKYNKASKEEKFELKDYIFNYTTSTQSYMINKKDREYIKNYKGLDDICITNLEYDNEMGLSNTIDDELEINRRCL